MKSSMVAVILCLGVVACGGGDESPSAGNSRHLSNAGQPKGLTSVGERKLSKKSSLPAPSEQVISISSDLPPPGISVDQAPVRENSVGSAAKNASAFAAEKHFSPIISSNEKASDLSPDSPLLNIFVDSSSVSENFVGSSAGGGEDYPDLLNSAARNKSSLASPITFFPSPKLLEAATAPGTPQPSNFSQSVTPSVAPNQSPASESSAEPLEMLAGNHQSTVGHHLSVASLDSEAATAPGTPQPSNFSQSVTPSVAPNQSPASENSVELLEGLASKHSALANLSNSSTPSPANLGLNLSIAQVLNGEDSVGLPEMLHGNPQSSLNPAAGDKPSPVLTKELLPLSIPESNVAQSPREQNSVLLPSTFYEAIKKRRSDPDQEPLTRRSSMASDSSSKHFSVTSPISPTVQFSVRNNSTSNSISSASYKRFSMISPTSPTAQFSVRNNSTSNNISSVSCQKGTHSRRCSVPITSFVPSTEFVPGPEFVGPVWPSQLYESTMQGLSAKRDSLPVSPVSWELNSPFSNQTIPKEEEFKISNSYEYLKSKVFNNFVSCYSLKDERYYLHADDSGAKFKLQMYFNLLPQAYPFEKEFLTLNETNITLDEVKNSARVFLVTNFDIVFNDTGDAEIRVAEIKTHKSYFPILLRRFDDNKWYKYAMVGDLPAWENIEDEHFKTWFDTGTLFAYFTSDELKTEMGERGVSSDLEELQEQGVEPSPF